MISPIDALETSDKIRKLNDLPLLRFGFSSPVHVVTHENVEFDVGKNSLFDADNRYRDQDKKIWCK
jgi:hypothetical protein